MRFRVTSLFLSLFTLVSVSAMAADEAQSYDLTCSHQASESKAVQFRFSARYTVNGDGTATLNSYRGLMFDDPGLMTLEVYESKGSKDVLKNDEKYNPKSRKWEGHLKFVLPAGVGPAMLTSSGGRNELFISSEPTSQKRDRVDNVPNPGTRILSKFHAGLEYYLGDYGNRTQFTCVGEQYVPDRADKE